MWLHCKNLLWQSWLALLSALGTTTLAVVVALVGFLFVLILNLIFKLRKDAWSWRVTVSHFTQNLRDSVVPTVIGTVVLWGLLYGTFVIRTTYGSHHDATKRWQEVVKEKDRLKLKLAERDGYIRRLEDKSCAVCLSARKIRQDTPIPSPQSPTTQQPRALSDLQTTVLQRDLKAGLGLRVRINVIGKSKDTVDLADDLRRLFDGWQIDGGNVGMANMPISSELEFAIPRPEDQSVQIATRAFDRAHITYSKNVDPYAYRGPASMGASPALTINVTDR